MISYIARKLCCSCGIISYMIGRYSYIAGKESYMNIKAVLLLFL